MQRHEKVGQFLPQSHRGVFIVEKGIAVELCEDVLELRREFAKHLAHFLGFIVVRQTGQRLKKDWKSIKFVPERENHANLLDVVTGGVSFEKVRLAPFLLLYVELCVFEHGIGDQGLHEVLRVDLLKYLRGDLKDGEYTLVKFSVIVHNFFITVLLNADALIFMPRV